MADLPSTPSTSPVSSARLAPGRALGLLGVFAVVLLAGLAFHLFASGAYRRSFDRSAPLERRAEAAAFARRLEPWDERYATRAIVMEKWLHGSVLLSQGADLPAMLELGAAYRLDVGDQELLALFKKSQEQLTVNSNFKAHVQHAHEGPGGTLRPQDLVR